MRKAYEPSVPSSRDATGLHAARDPLRRVALRALDGQASIAALNFSLVGASLRDVARTLSRRRTAWDDWSAAWIAFAIRHGVRSMHWSEAVRRTLHSGMRAPAAVRRPG